MTLLSPKCGKNHYQALYNSVHDDGAKKEFLDRLSHLDKYSNTYVINVHDISMYCSKQKKGKPVGPDGIPMEALIYGGTRLHIHLALLFNCFYKNWICSLPKSFMQSLIIPLIKSKSADFTDVNNYSMIAVSTAATKLFECIVAEEYHSTSPEDMYQFGFTVLNLTIPQDFVQVFINYSKLLHGAWKSCIFMFY